MERARSLLRHLRAALLEYRNGGLSYAGEPLGDGEWKPLPAPDGFVPDVALSTRGVFEILEALETIINDAKFDWDPSDVELPPGETWSIGSSALTFPIRSILRGFAEPVLRVPVLPPLSDRLVAFLRIAGESDLLERERHNQVGWHYHYLDAKKARSDVVLCWDTRPVYDKAKEHPLFQEFHGEGHAKFRGRPHLWGAEKKKSMHDACAPDLEKWPLSSFRCASAKSGPVWPPSAILTPIPAVLPPGPKFPAKKLGNDRR